MSIICRDCQKTLRESDFFPSSLRRGDRQCRRCKTIRSKDAHRRYVLRHPDKVKISNKRSERKRRANGKTSEYRFKRREWYRKYKSETPCVDCGCCFSAECMDFDHVGNKTKQVSHLVTGGYSAEAIRKEMEQCDLVCSNCHRIRTCARKASRRLAILEHGLQNVV